MAKRNRKAKAVDVKAAQANDKTQEAPAPVKRVPKSASPVAKGATYHVLAGRPSKQAVIVVFGKSGYALSWVARAKQLECTPEELCAMRQGPEGGQDTGL